MSAIYRAGSCVIALLMFAIPVLAQPALNIAGTYRGLMTECLSKVRSADCRKGMFVLIELADKVDAKRAEWERSAAAGGISSDSLLNDYNLAAAQLASAVADFNLNVGADAGVRPVPLR